jgi:hypothetical protein
LNRFGSPLDATRRIHLARLHLIPEFIVDDSQLGKARRADDG